MTDFETLKAVRNYLLKEKVASQVHLTLPPKVVYPLVLLELEEIWSPYLLKASKRKEILARVKFKISVYSQNPGMEEATLLSNKIRRTLEGVCLSLHEHEEVRRAEEEGRGRSATLRFLACVAEKPGSVSSTQRLNAVHHFFDSIVRG